MRNLQHIWFTLAFVFGALFQGQAQQVSRFQKVIGGSNSDLSYDIKNTLDGGFILTGSTSSYGAGGSDIFLIKTDGNGGTEWRKTYGGSGTDAGWKVITTSDSGFIVAGATSSYGRGRADAIVFKTNKSGDVQWTRTFGTDSTEEAYSLVQTSSGSIYVTGFAVTDSFSGDLFIAKLTSTGTLSWFKTFGDIGFEEGFDIMEESRGDLVAVGFTNWDKVTAGANNGNPGDKDILMVKVDTAGTLKWMKNYGGDLNDEAWSVAQYRGEYYVTGFTESFGSGNQDIFMLHVDQAGNTKNMFGIQDAEDERAFDIKLIPGTDRFVITGYQQLQGRTDRNVVHLQLTSGGNVNSFEFIGASDRDGHWPTAAVHTPDNGFAIFSTSRSFTTGTGDKLYLVKTNDRGVSPCHTRSQLQSANPSSVFDNDFNTFRNRSGNSSPTLTVNNFTPSLDSTICCQLDAIVAADSMSICFGSSVALGGPAISGVTYEWTASGSSFTSSMANPVIFPDTTRVYKLKVSSSNSMCKADSATIRVVVKKAISSTDLIRDTSFCEGGSLQLTTFTGQSYYEWKGRTVSGFGQGVTLNQSDTVTLFMIDNLGCQFRDTARVIRNLLPRFSLGRDSTICSNVSLTLQGPTKNIRSWNWNNTGASTNSTLVTGLEQSHTLVVIDSNGCVFSDTMAIFNNPVSSFSLGSDTGFCAGSSFTILGPGFLGGYRWNDTASTLTNLTVNRPGTYWLSAVNSFNCRYADTITIREYSPPVLNLGSDTGLCSGGIVVLRSPLSGLYLWNGNPNRNTDTLQARTAGTYWLRYTDRNGCIDTDSIEVMLYLNPAVNLGNDTTICIGDTLTLNAGAGNASYLWSDNSRNQTLKVWRKGTYNVLVTSDKGCETLDEIVVDTIRCANSLAPAAMAGIRVYPNPFSSELTADFGPINGAVSVILMEAGGREVLRSEVPASERSHTLSTRNLAPGMYILRFENSDAQWFVKILKQ